jgi:hypothetical protein
MQLATTTQRLQLHIVRHSMCTDRTIAIGAAKPECVRLADIAVTLTAQDIACYLLLSLLQVRGLQHPADGPMPVFADNRTLKAIRRVFPYLCTDSGGKVGIRQVAALDFQPFAPNQPFTVAGLKLMVSVECYNIQLCCRTTACDT